MTDDASLFEALTTLQRTAARGLTEALSAEGFSVDQWRLLRRLADGGGHRIGELAATLVVPLPTMTRLADGLVELGLVYRRPAEHDRRSVELFLARQGRQLLGRLDAVAEPRLRELTRDPAWRALLDHGAATSATLATPGSADRSIWVSGS